MMSTMLDVNLMVEVVVQILRILDWNSCINFRNFVMKFKLQVKKIVMILVVTHLSKCRASRAFFCDDKAIISKTMMMVVIVAEPALALIGDVFLNNKGFEVNMLMVTD